MPPRKNASAYLAILADASSLEPPKHVAEYSSHALLWDAIAAELLANPFTLTNVDAFLDERMRQLQIAPDNFNRLLFIERLIMPAYQQGLAQLLVRHGIPVRCHGRGWEKIEALGECAAGQISTREQFDAAIGAATALLHCWPTEYAHPVDAAGRPVLRAFGKSRDQFLRDAKAALEGALPLHNHCKDPLTAQAALIGVTELDLNPEP
jgi:hypothetical protein